VILLCAKCLIEYSVNHSGHYTQQQNVVLLGRLGGVDLIKPVSNVHMSIRTSVHSQKVSSISMKFGM